MNTVVRPPCPELREPCTRRMPFAAARLAHTRFWLGPNSGTRIEMLTKQTGSRDVQPHKKNGQKETQKQKLSCFPPNHSST